MEQLHYNLLYRWFVGLGVDDPVWVPTVFTKNRDRLLQAEVARKFLAELFTHKEVRKLLSDDHFSVDGTQITAWASMKSFVAKDGSGDPPPSGPNGGGDFPGRGAISRRGAQPRDAPLHHRPRRQVVPEGQRQGGETLLYWQRHDRKPQRLRSGGGPAAGVGYGPGRRGEGTDVCL